MALTTEAFDAMERVPYSQARNSLRTGDVLLFHSTGFSQEIIEIATHSLWCHAAFIWYLPSVKRLMILESVDKIGVRCMPMSTLVNGNAAAPTPYPGKLAVLRHSAFPPPPNDDKISVMTQFALDRLGYPYSTEEILGIAARITAGIAGLTLPGRLDPKNQFICSEYVAKCYAEIGLDLAPDKDGFIAPADIADDPHVSAIYSIRPDIAAAT